MTPDDHQARAVLIAFVLLACILLAIIGTSYLSVEILFGG